MPRHHRNCKVVSWLHAIDEYFPMPRCTCPGWYRASEALKNMGEERKLRETSLEEDLENLRAKVKKLHGAPGMWFAK